MFQFVERRLRTPCKATVSSTKSLLRRHGVAACLFGLLLLCAPAASQAAETGVVPDLTWGINASAHTQTANALQDLGAGWVRMSVSWSDDVEPSKGTYRDLSRFDNAVETARNAGYRVILMV